MEHRELKKLVQLMNDNELVELEIEEEGRRVLLRKAGSVAPAALPPAYGPPPYGPPPAAGAPSPAAPAEAPASEGGDGPAEVPGTKLILSPMVGTFYRRPSPDAEPYVDVGDKVEADTVVCIVEAMKVNNELKAELAGEIVEVLVEDGQPVEFDEPLFRVRIQATG